MKRILKNFGFVLAAALLVTACEEKFKVLDPSNYGVKFKAESGALTEATTVIDIPVNRSSPDATAAIDITYDVGGTATDGPDYTFNTTKGTLTIPAGAYTASVKINLKQDVAVEPTETILLTLKTATGGMKVGVGGTGGTTYAVSITDDDCVYTEADYIKTAQGREVYASSCYPSNCTSTYSVPVIKTGTNTLQVQNFWAEGWKINLVIDPVLLTITIPTIVFTDTSADNFGTVTVSGSGTISTCTKTFTFQTVESWTGGAQGTGSDTNSNIYKF